MTGAKLPTRSSEGDRPVLAKGWTKSQGFKGQGRGAHLDLGVGGKPGSIGQPLSCWGAHTWPCFTTLPDQVLWETGGLSRCLRPPAVEGFIGNHLNHTWKRNGNQHNFVKLKCCMGVRTRPVPAHTAAFWTS